ncbi:MAG TPA: hypothetical protein VGF26_10750, partial [Ramlibacter sp.]
MEQLQKFGWRLAAALCVVGLSACGGGGGGGGASPGVTVTSTSITLPAELVFQGGVELLHPATIRPGLAGFEGKAFSCTFISGALPAGLALGSDCMITGRATQPGHPNAVVNVTIAGVSGTMTWNLSIDIATPGANYNVTPIVSFGTAIDLKPEPAQWKPVPGDTLTYAVTGTLPP